MDFVINKGITACIPAPGKHTPNSVQVKRMNRISTEIPPSQSKFKSGANRLPFGIENGKDHGIP